MIASPRRGGVYLCYFDESGDSGYNNSLTNAYALAGVLIHDSAWLPVLDDVISFRRYLRDEFRLPMRAELKAGSLIHNNGDFLSLGLGTQARMRIYTMALRLMSKLGDGQGVKVFAVVVDKPEMVKCNHQRDDPAREVWEKALERLERFTVYNKDTCMIFPDQGNYEMIRAILREKRRFSYVPSHYGTQPLSRPASFVLEDPSARASHESYFIQLADLAAYAAHRVVYPTAWFDGHYWGEIGDARIEAVNKFSGGPKGIVLWPPEKWRK